MYKGISRPLVVCLVAGIALLAPVLALACGCCDGQITRVPLAWSAGGETLLVLRDGSKTCEDTLAIEVFDPGSELPRGCLDLWGLTPWVETPCSQLRSGDDARAIEGRVEAADAHPGVGRHPFESLDPAEYPVFARALPSHRVRSTLGGGPGSGYRSWIRVETESGGTWRHAWSGTTKILDWSSGIGARSWFYDTEATVWPSPDRKQAAIVVTNDHPGRDFEDVVHWARLDAPLSPRRNVAELVVRGTAKDQEEPWLNLRAGPAARSVVVANLPDGTWLARDEAPATGASSPGWIPVFVVGGANHGARGWVHEKWVTAIPEPNAPPTSRP